MSHYRRTIREAIVAALASAGTAAGANVFDHPFNLRKTFPALVVEDVGANFSDGNVTEVQGLQDLHGNVERRYRFAVIAEVAQSTDSAGDRDDLVGEVEAVVAAASIAGVIGPIRPLAYSAADSNDGDRPIRRGMQVFEATYITPFGDPSTPLS